MRQITDNDKVVVDKQLITDAKRAVNFLNKLVDRGLVERGQEIVEEYRK
jgi:hypothetical protein